MADTWGLVGASALQCWLEKYPLFENNRNKQSLSTEIVAPPPYFAKCAPLLQKRVKINEQNFAYFLPNNNDNCMHLPTRNLLVTVAGFEISRRDFLQKILV